MPEEGGAVEFEVVEFWAGRGGRRRRGGDGGWRRGTDSGEGWREWVDRCDVGVLDDAVEARDLFRRIEFAKVTEIVVADEELRGGTHGIDIEHFGTIVGRTWRNGGVREEIAVAALLTGETR